MLALKKYFITTKNITVFVETKNIAIGQLISKKGLEFSILPKKPTNHEKKNPELRIVFSSLFGRIDNSKN